MATTKKEKKATGTNRVCLITWADLMNGVVNFLCYGDGTIRTYEPGKLDPRSGKNLTEVKTTGEFWKALDAASCARPVVAPVEMVRMCLGLKRKEFAL